ncbi:erythromycin esterase family protein [Streptomyces sp. NPDC056231]|uniref:erythromycin esterase family protein n=1 Tax=Streptomyces sp. NPDC056231 TaxID=3345755 RepID=UPI003AAF4D3F
MGTEFGYDLFDPAEIPQAMRYRDRVMAENTVWWQRQTGHRMLLSAHDGHVAYESGDPANYPTSQGAFLRDMVGDDYLTAGFTFGQGSFNANDMTDPAEPVRVFSVGPLEPGSNEHTLNAVSPGDYYLDLRTTPAPARAWLAEPRPTRFIGTAWPTEPLPVRLAPSFDVLFHLHRITAADLL